jgi:hypothetical protein
VPSTSNMKPENISRSNPEISSTRRPVGCSCGRPE